MTRQQQGRAHRLAMQDVRELELRELREAVHVTQVVLAKKLKTTQAAIFGNTIGLQMNTIPKQFWPWYMSQNGVPGLDRLPRPWGRIASSFIFVGLVIVIWKVWFLHFGEPGRSFFTALLRNAAWWVMLACIYLYNVELRFFRAQVEEVAGRSIASIPFGNAKILVAYKDLVGGGTFYRSCRILPWLIVLLFFASVIPTVSRIQREPYLGPAPTSNSAPVTPMQTGGTARRPVLPDPSDGTMPTVYSTVYLVTRQGFDWKLIVPAAVLLLVGWSAVRLSRTPRIKALAWVIFVVGIFISFLLLLVLLEGYLTNSWEFQRNHYQTVEGLVENFHPMPYQGREDESFSVNGTNFSYSDFMGTTSCFNRTASHGGPIRDGLQVRIAFIDNGCILQLEVAAKSTSNP